MHASTLGSTDERLTVGILGPPLTGDSTLPARSPARAVRALLASRKPATSAPVNTATEDGPSPLTSNLVTVGTGLRVRMLPDTDTPLDGEVTALEAAERLRADQAHGPQHVDAVLVEGRVSDAVGTQLIVDEAVADHVPVVVHRPRSDTPTLEPHAIAVGAGAEDGPFNRPIINVREVNPVGFRRHVETITGTGTFAPGPGYNDALEQVKAAIHAANLDYIEVTVPTVTVTVPPASAGATSAAAAAATNGASTSGRPGRALGSDELAVLLPRLRPLTGIVDHPGLHAEAADHAAWLVTVAAAGTPVAPIEPLPDAVTALLGPRLSEAINTTTVAMLTDPDEREHASVRSRTAAMREHGAGAAWQAIAQASGLPVPQQPSVSVLLATNRPEHLLHAAEQHERFGYENKELIAVLHGDGFGPDAETQLGEAVTSDVTVLRAPETARLGHLMNLATNAASGQVVTKLDDDDLYDVDHLDDLVQALRYSGKTVVAKGSEFVYLAEIDLTIRRMPHGVETGSRSVAGGTLTIARDDLIRVGRWQNVPRSIDQLLIGDVLAAGGELHRTHGHGFVLNRHGRGHTWDSSVDRFLQHAVSQWPGLDLAAAGFRDRERTLP